MTSGPRNKVIQPSSRSITTSCNVSRTTCSSSPYTIWYVGIARSPLAERRSVEPLDQSNRHRVACFLPYRFANVGPYRKLVPAVAQRHERAAEWVTVDRSTHLDESPGAEEGDRPRHDH